MNLQQPVTDSEDAAFYAQITRRILLLMDEDDETHANRTMKHAPQFERRLVGEGCGDGGHLFSGKDFGWLEVEVPGWMERLWANSGGGTGVFIPREVAAGKPRRKRYHRSRKNKDGGRMHSCGEKKFHVEP
ncbi:hypothetical protein QVD17_33043 [Tagetes erecta]|uniref:Uncharacterized protein n=1 Tax=Tagetes erecta TaxID=13708 RepID=A0AAD8K0J0_TARER|nr:hypothetical protein QVD17_33043 [Tagetes erecta]